MNYRHIYHAGNVADLFKHVLLLGLLQALARKETPYFVLDTHAGIGLYDLDSAEAAKTGEYRQGVGLLQDTAPEAPLLQDFITLVWAINAGKGLRSYPGSPLIVARTLRVQDRAAACELHPEDYPVLRRMLRPYPAIAVHHRNGYEAIGALLPPAQKRGLILIDPPFEEVDEFEQLIEAVRVGTKRFPAGSWALWYPIKERAAIWRFHEAITAAIEAPLLAIEFMLRPETDSRTLNGSGMLLIRPPYLFDETIKAPLLELRQLLGLPGDGLLCEWLKPPV
jgi:23S rRNA (adenine2030-N6)-methyltransferase